MYDKVSTNFEFVNREKKVLDFWNENHIFEKSIDSRKNAETFTFYDGPPTANGKPHIGHVLTRVIKDMIPRYKTMKGYMVPRKAGWDTHGLPVEIEVEKLLGIEGKQGIEEYGLEPFIKKCKESVWKYKGMWEDFSGKVGFWADMKHPYVTYDNTFIESEWWALKQIWDKGLLYKGFKIVPYCPRCGTPLSSQEVAQGYKDVKERSAVVKFKAKGEEAYFLAWTTTPWTLPSNVALCVNPAEDYVKIKVEDGTVYYMAQALVEKFFPEGVETLATFKGKELEYREYEPLFECTKSNDGKKGWYVTCDGYVTLTDGTGIVHIAPAFGEDDANVGKNYDLPFVQLVDAAGCMDKSTPWAGKFCKDADKDVLVDLDKRGLLFSAPVFEHSYPHCWRCDTPLIYYARDSWFIKMTAVRDDLVRNNNTVNWIPESIGKGRFGDWIENVQDWSISRNRYWGTPLNVWECECGHRHSIGSIEELKSMSSNCPDDIELHRPYIDAVTIKCRSAAARCTACLRLSTAGSTPARCPSRSTTIRLKITTCSSSSSRRSLFPRLSIRREAGSIRCSPFRPCCSTERPMRMFLSSVTFRMRTDRRCQSPRATPSTRSTRSTPTAQTQSAGISTPTPLPGCPTASTARLLSRVSASSWAHSGTSTLSSCSMQI